MTVSHIKVGTEETGEETAGVCENKQEKGSKNNATGKERRNIQWDWGQTMREEGKELVAWVSQREPKWERNFLTKPVVNHVKCTKVRGTWEKAIGLVESSFRSFTEAGWPWWKANTSKSLKKIKTMTVDHFLETGTEGKGVSTYLLSEWMNKWSNQMNRFCQVWIYGSPRNRKGSDGISDIWSRRNSRQRQGQTSDVT